jgi:ribosomal protein S12
VPEKLDGRKLLAALCFGSKADIAKVGIRLWDSIPDARDASRRIDVLARHMLAVEEHNATEAAACDCPLEAAIKASGLSMPPKEVLDAIREIAGIEGNSKVEVVAFDGDDGKFPDDSLVDDDHGLPMECFIALQKALPGIRVVRGKVVSCRKIPVVIAQEILDLTLAEAERVGLV